MSKKDKIQLRRDNKVCELVELTCPACGASLNLIDKTHAKCSFCGKEIVIDEAAGTDVYIDVDSQGIDQIHQNVSVIAGLLKGMFRICVMAAVLAAIFFVSDCVKDGIKSSSAGAHVSERMEDCGVRRGLEQIFHKNFALITDQELSSIRYIDEDIESMSDQFVITYSFEDYDQYENLADYSDTFQECRVDMRNVSWTKDYSALTGLQGFQDSTHVLSELTFAPGLKLKFYVGQNDVITLQEKTDVSEIRELKLLECDSSLTGIEAFQSLEQLEVHGFYGELYDIDNITSCQKLKKLTLESGEELTDFAPLYQLEGLEELSLYCTGMKSIDFVNRMPLLKKLAVLGGEEIDFSPVEGAAGLTELDLYDLTDLSVLMNLTKLEKLRLRARDAFFVGHEMDYGMLASIPSLKKLELYGDPNLKTEVVCELEPLFNNEQIQELALTNLECSIDSSIIEENHTMNNLDMSGTRFFNQESGEGYSFIRKMQGLKTLVLKNCDLRDVSFMTGMSDLKSCNVETNFISDFSPLGQNPQLEVLYCGDNTTSLVNLPERVTVYTKLTAN